MTDPLGWRTALFSAKCFAAAMLAYYIALRIGLTRPYWAVTTSYIVAQPLAGAVVSKAVFRIAGTVLGAVAAVVMVPNLTNAPELLSLALALWLGLCLYVSLHDRTPRSYVFLLAGYTASIIGIPSVGAPGAIFTTAILRVQEIGLGILCGSAVHALVLPQTVTAQLLQRVAAITADVERWSIDALGEAGDAALDRDRRRLALDIFELHQLSTHLPFDLARLRPRVRTVRAVQDQLSLLLPLASAVEDRMRELDARGGIPPALREVIAQTRGWLRRPATSMAERAVLTDDLIARARAAEPPAAPVLPWTDALVLSLAARLAELIAAHRAVRDLGAQLRSPTREAVTPVAAAALRQATGRSFHRDRALATRAAGGTIATMLLGSLFWIETGWPEGGGAVLIAGVCCSLFGNSDNPAPSIRTFLWGTIGGIAIAAVYGYAILPRATDFATVAAALAPPLLVLGAMLANPATTLVTLGMLLGFLNVAGLNASYAGDFAEFVNGAVAQIIGTGFAVVTVSLFQTAGAQRSVDRLIHAGWRDLARRSTLPGAPDVGGWISRMLDRLGLLAPRLAAAGDDPGRPLVDVLVDLRVGVSVAGLRSVRLTAGDAGRAMIGTVLAETSRHYAARRVDAPPPDDPALLHSIDTAMAGFAADDDGDERRAALLSLVSLRRNLFPAAPPPPQTVMVSA